MLNLAQIKVLNVFIPTKLDSSVTWMGVNIIGDFSFLWKFMMAVEPTMLSKLLKIN